MSALRMKNARQVSSSSSAPAFALHGSDKENLAPKGSSQQKSSSGAARKVSRSEKRYEVDNRDDEDVVEVIVTSTGAKKRKQDTDAAASSRSRQAPSSSSADAMAGTQQRKTSGSAKSAVTKRDPVDDDQAAADEYALGDQSLLERRWEDKAKRLEAERDQIQNELDELRELRYTEAERQFVDLKRAAESKHKALQDVIATLKARVDLLEKRGGGAGVTASNMTPEPTEDKLAVAELERELARERADSEKRERKLKDQVSRLSHELEAEVAASKKLLMAHDRRTASASAVTGSRAGSTAAALGSSGLGGASSVGLGDQEKAMRRLYEDLTGMIINSVERDTVDPEMKIFKGCFASEGFHNVEFSIEESTSEQDDIDARGRAIKSLREDLVFVPNLDARRDADLLDNPDVPEYFKDPVRFERSKATKFISALLKAYKQ